MRLFTWIVSAETAKAVLAETIQMNTYDVASE